ncbi:MAG: hypothetical protein AAGB34_06250 [Planctomycetota bacterium]
MNAMTELFSEVAQLGAAGVIGLMWLLERRAAGERERRLDEAHRKLMVQRVQLGELMKLVSDNTRAMLGLESSQRAILGVLRRTLTDDEAAPDQTG